MGLRGGSTTGGLQAASSCSCPPRLCLEHLFPKSSPKPPPRGSFLSFPEPKTGFLPWETPSAAAQACQGCLLLHLQLCKSVLCLCSAGCCESPHGRAPASQGGSGSSQSRTTAWPCPALCKAQPSSLLLARCQRDQGGMFKKGLGVWTCSAPPVMCKGWFCLCNTHGKPRCPRVQSSCRQPGPPFTSPRSGQKFRAVSMQRAASSAFLLSVAFRKLFLSCYQPW